LAPSFRILAHDHRLVVVDKDAGVTSEDVAASLGRRLVHRIDRSTSGLLLLADDARTVQRLQRLLSPAPRTAATTSSTSSARSAAADDGPTSATGVVRTYLALASGAVDPGVIDRALVHPGRRGRRRSVAPDDVAGDVDVAIAIADDRGDGAPRAGADGARPARTVVDVLAVGGGVTLVRATLITGRTHQVRIHLADSGHPILGDRVYGGDVATAAPRLMLHAWRLAFVHPNTRVPVAFRSPPPPDFGEVVTQRCDPAAWAALTGA
jgi:23S rRNA-/tRNA-specific pseudouridylate synthase